MHSAEGLSSVNGTSPEPRYRVAVLTSHDTTAPPRLSIAPRLPAVYVGRAENPGPPPNVPGFSRERAA